MKIGIGLRGFVWILKSLFNYLANFGMYCEVFHGRLCLKRIFNIEIFETKN